MEAPEKIYFSGQQQWSNRFFDLMQKRTDTDIEYTRTDAFVEKAEKYLTEKFIKDVSILAGGVVNINFSTAIKNFVEYMKGE